MQRRDCGARQCSPPVHPAGVATLDYVLLMGVVLPLAAVVIPLSMRAMRLVFEFAAVTISWAFL